VEGSEPCGLLRAARRIERGQSLTEFAISAVVLILLMGGLLDIGRSYYWSIDLHNAAREGGRHAAWFDATRRLNPYLDQADLKSAVDDVLAGDLIPASQLQSGCPATADGNTQANPPYISSAYPTQINQPWLYICYRQGGGTLPATTPPADPSGYWLQDLTVIVLVSYGPITTQALQGAVGANIKLVGYFTIAIQGHP
jgi:hypothetical protein